MQTETLLRAVIDGLNQRKQHHSRKLKRREDRVRRDEQEVVISEVDTMHARHAALETLRQPSDFTKSIMRAAAEEQAPRHEADITVLENAGSGTLDGHAAGALDALFALEVLLNSGTKILLLALFARHPLRPSCWVKCTTRSGEPAKRALAYEGKWRGESEFCVNNTKNNEIRWP